MQITYFPNLLIEVEAMLTPEVHFVVNAYAEQVAARAEQLAPVRTGALAASIHVVPGGLGSPAEAEVIAEVPYSGCVEFGTSDTSAQPFLRPGLDGVIPGRTD